MARGPDGRQGQARQAARAYWARPNVHEDLRRANEKCFRRGSHRQTMDTPRTRVFFAYALWRAGAADPAAEHLRIIGPRTPWGPFTPGVLFLGQTIQRARRECGVR